MDTDFFDHFTSVLPSTPTVLDESPHAASKLIEALGFRCPGGSLRFHVFAAQYPGIEASAHHADGLTRRARSPTCVAPASHRASIAESKVRRIGAQWQGAHGSLFSYTISRR